MPRVQVSTEAPKFKTVASDDVMKVVQPPSSPPRYDGDDDDDCNE